MKIAAVVSTKARRLKPGLAPIDLILIDIQGPYAVFHKVVFMKNYLGWACRSCLRDIFSGANIVEWMDLNFE
ncbi:hypothetical protein [Pseudomonas palleroniana]|uniref:hypothetical protein n=1 Tax=Pseudomonas palleroniana TaxID=191390 RepID=UPI001FD19E01|nr:hypothetical protein [Pseudomonas palleroniana]UOP11300.1 hypothetical protein LDL65_01705 [Pseudomonas palleroniana]